MIFPVVKMSAEALAASLREHFGFDGFLGRQAEAVEAVLAGRDVLVTMPTGAGKSLVYQLPAVLLDGQVLVISPLIALMKDQVDDLRDELLVKNRGDNRVGISLKWLEVLGVTGGSFETNDLRLAAPLDPDVLPDFVGSEEKLRGDLEALLGMLQFAKERDVCRRVLLARHFGLEEPAEPCGACDVCEDRDAWLSARATPRASVAPPPERGDGWRRGDWVRVDGRHLGHVVRVEGEGRRLRLVVESAGDLRRRTIDPRRRRVERVEG